MVSIKAQSSPQNAARYFGEHLSHDDYYSDRQHTPGWWFGRGCQALGLDSQAPVRKEDFAALCKGLRPDDWGKLTQRMTDNRRCLYDITLSAPKSASIMALIGDERIIAAHEQAVTATLAAAEKLAAVRVRKGAAVDTRQARVTGNIVCARFLHRESRALDPQLHTHCIVFNVTHDPVENRMKALEARPIYDHAQELTQLYRAHLAESLHALGYDVYLDKHRCPQIRGVDTNLMARFSKRSAQRDALVALREQELGRPLTKDEVAHVVHRHRAKKQKHIASEALRQIQLGQLTPAERVQLTCVKTAALAGQRPPVVAPPAIAPPIIPQPQQSAAAVALSGPSVSWLAMLRLSILATRAIGFNPYTFTPNASIPRRIYYAARFVHQAQRAANVGRYMRTGKGQSRSR